MIETESQTRSQNWDGNWDAAGPGRELLHFNGKTRKRLTGKGGNPVNRMRVLKEKS